MKNELPIKAWAVLDVDRKLAVVDGRLPVFWLRNVANAFNRERFQGDGYVVRVTVVS